MRNTLPKHTIPCECFEWNLNSPVDSRYHLELNRNWRSGSRHPTQRKNSLDRAIFGTNLRAVGFFKTKHSFAGKIMLAGCFGSRERVSCIPVLDIFLTQDAIAGTGKTILRYMFGVSKSN